MSFFEDQIKQGAGKEADEQLAKTEAQLAEEQAAKDAEDKAAQDAANAEAEAAAKAAGEQTVTLTAEEQAAKDAEEAAAAAPTKVNIDYKEWFQTHEGTFYEYLKEKNTDYKSLSKEDVVRLKAKQDHPEYSETDISELMAEKYGVGVDLIVIDLEQMDEDEVEEAKAFNKALKALQTKGGRDLKTDAALAAKEFEERKSSLTLPDFEVDAPKVEKPVVFDEKAYLESSAKALQENKEKYWIPSIKQVLEPLESVTEKVEYEDNGNKVVLDVTYTLSKDEKEEVLRELEDYISKPSDQQYLDAEGKADVQRFVQDKTKELQYKKLLKTVAKESAILARKSFVKNDLLNHDDGTRHVGNENIQEQDFATQFFSRGAAIRNKQ